jgi:acyl-CoA reductase-like NAD-dependent aldehyde dehydrogenase
MYLGVVQGLKCGHPLLVDKAEDALPALDFGPLINSKKVEELRVQVGEAVAGGAVALYEGRLDEARFQPSQDISAYLAPVALLNLPRNCKLYHGEPFGPVDSVTVVDSVDQMVAEMNVSNGNLVSSLATDDAGLAKQVAMDLRCFKFGHNRVRSRGDNEESFGGFGQSWKGCFVGG